VTPRLIIFDADGTLRRTLVPGQPCPHAADEWELLEGVRAYVSSLPPDLHLGVASNQDHVGYGHLSYAEAHSLLSAALLQASGRTTDAAAIRLCPHRLEVECSCRKPAPGMLLAIAQHYGVAPSESLFVGNEPVDELAAQNAGMPFVWAHELWPPVGGGDSGARSAGPELDGAPGSGPSSQ
jgi:D-glycero-D-manno-heptose 1,7-bisphosphate phosphatase